MIRIARAIISLGGILLGLGLAGEVYNWYGSNVYFLMLASVLFCGGVARLAASFVK